VKLLALALAVAALCSSGSSIGLRPAANLPGTAAGTDLAFWGNLAFQGTYDGFRIVDISTPSRPVLVADVRCRGPQSDLSVWGSLLFLSVDRPQTKPACDSEDAPSETDPGAFEGIRIFDVSNPEAPRLVAAVPTDCGSHTNSLLPQPDRGRVLLYVSSYPLVPGPACGPGRESDPRHGKISIVEVPLAAPETARVVAAPPVDAKPFFETAVGCHDFTFFLPRALAAASCMSEGQLWDVSDPLRPRIIARIRNPAFFFWHSASFTWDGRYVVFGDESFPGSCNTPKKLAGRVWIYRVDAPVRPVASFAIPRRQPKQVCSAHLFNFVPVQGRYLLAASWYEGGADLVDFTDPAHPHEIASFDPGANDWAAYWYDGAVYASDFRRGLDVLAPSGVRGRALDHLNPQTQELLLP
jgi:hypothetical protein